MSWQGISGRRFFLSRLSTVVFSWDKVIQTKLLYRSYYTPCLLYFLNRLSSASCYRCNMADGTFYLHDVEMSTIRRFWSEVTALFSSITQIPNICNPWRCLLGDIDDKSLSNSTQTSLRIGDVPVNLIKSGTHRSIQIVLYHLLLNCWDRKVNSEQFHMFALSELNICIIHACLIYPCLNCICITIYFTLRYIC